ncbi:MAG: ABC transporter substrate-binding protein [Deltaproteobacteria bacterium]|nr:ABC transporter substrate-binding protein [Deltaproteobacteria bacterium]
MMVKVVQIMAAFLVPVLLALPSSEAQQAKKVPRIGFLSGAHVEPFREAFRQGLRELGYVEGQNIAIEWQHADGKVEGLPALAAELVRVKADVIVTGGTPALLAAKDATRTIPIVLCIGDPVGEGFVASLARPRGNITGLSAISTDLSGKRLELLKETVPGLARVGVLWNRGDQGDAANFKETVAVAQALRLRVQSLEVRSSEDFESVFKAASGGRVHGLIVLPGSLIARHRTRIVALVAKNRLPAVYGNSWWVEAGGLMYYGPNINDLFRRAATYVDKILKGAKPADLPVEQPMKFELVINLKTAKALGIKIPAHLLMEADKVIE